MQRARHPVKHSLFPLYVAKRHFVTDVKLTGAKCLQNREWDALVVGGGHNGLVAAAYLARAGLQVLVLERRHVLGGAAVTEEVVPGFKFSRASYLQSLLRPRIIRDLELPAHGLKLLPRNPSSFTPTTHGQYLLMGADRLMNRAQISKFSSKDAAMYPLYEQQLRRFCEIVDPLFDVTPPQPPGRKGSWKQSLRDGWHRTQVLAALGQRFAGLPQKEIAAFLELLLAPASKVLNQWFESEVLKATIATDAVIGAMAGVNTPGSGYVLLHHVMGETNGDRGVWSYVQGGMGAVSMAVASAAHKAGATMATNAQVQRFLIDRSSTADDVYSVSGVMLEDGTCIKARKVLSNATPAVTFLDLLPEEVLPEQFVADVKAIDYSSGTTKMNVAVAALPRFKVCGDTGVSPGPEHVGTIHLGAESMKQIEEAYRDSLRGHSSLRPLIEMTIPSVVDETISPPGKHVINMFIQYTPYLLKRGSWNDSITREEFASRCFELVEEYAPGFKSSVIDYEMLTPPDLERIFSLTGGNIFHGAMGLDALFLLRPVKGWSLYRTPVKDLYLCGAGAHPGGAVMGAAGRNCALAVLDDLSS